MDGLDSVSVLLLSTASVAFVHALAPDHWIPFTSIAHARGWTTRRLLGVTALSGVGHVGSSILIGSVGLALGFGLTGLEAVESQRAEVAGLLLIGFGLVYGIWGLRHARNHVHVPDGSGRQVTVWMLVALFVLGPCEPLIPLMFVSASQGWHTVSLVAGVFGAITLVMMVGQAWLAYRGIEALSMLRVSHRHGHAIAGGVIALTGAMVMMLGI